MLDNSLHQILLDFERDFNNFTDCVHYNIDDPDASEYQNMTLNEMAQGLYNFMNGKSLFKDFAEYLADKMNMEKWVEDWTRENVKEIANKPFREVYATVYKNVLKGLNDRK